jgi:glycosyltransferase involved in cell wall biosynthesis
MDYFFLIGTLNLSGAELNLLRLSNLIAEKGNFVYIFFKRGEIPKFNTHKNVKIISTKNLKDYYQLVKNKVFTVYSYPLAYKLLLRSTILKLNLKIVIRHATYLKPWFEYIPIEYGIFNVFIGFFYYNISIFLLFFFKYHIALNNEMAYELKKRLFFSKKKIIVINNFISDHIFEKYPNKIPEFEMAFVARIVKEKGIFDFLAMLEKLNYRYKTLIIGKIPNYNKELLKKFDSKKNIFYVPFDIDYINKYLSKTKLLVFPSFREGSPNVVLEALGLGLPVVAYDCKTGLKDLINPNNGYLVPTGNVKILKETVEKALNRTWDIDLIKTSVVNHKTETIVFEFLRLISKIDDQTI